MSKLESIKATKVEVDVERKRIDSFTALKDGSTTGDSELTDIRVGYDSTTYNTAGDAVQGQVESVNQTIDALMEYIDVSSMTRDTPVVIKQYMGSINENDIINITPNNLRISTKPFYINEDCTIVASDGFEFTVYYLDNEVIIKYSEWSTYYTLRKNYKYAVLLRKTDNSEIFKSDLYKGFKILPPIECDNFKLCTGSYVGKNFNEDIECNSMEIGSKVRLHVTNKFNKTIKITKLVDVPIDVYYVMNESKFNSDTLINSGDIIYGDAKICLRIDDYPDQSAWKNLIKIEEVNDFMFTAGTIEGNVGEKMKISNDDSILHLRLRTNIIDLEDGYKISVSSDYSLSITYFDENDVITDNIYWVNEYYLKPGRVALVLKKNSGNSIFMKDVTKICKFEKLDTVDSKKSVLFIGDSITENNFTTKCNWTRMVQAVFDISTYANIAEGGTGIIIGGNNNWLTKLDSSPAIDYDLILIMGNMNDYSNNIFTNSNLGTMGDNGTNTQYGAVSTFLKKLVTKYPNSKIGWIISTPRQYYSADKDTKDPVVTEGYLYGDINSVFSNAVKAIKDVCGHYSIPVLDLYHSSNFKCWDKSVKDTYFYNDGNMVHPNMLGHELMCKQIIPFIKSIL